MRGGNWLIGWFWLQVIIGEEDLKVIRSGVVFLERTQVVIAESSAVVRLFSPFPSQVSVNITRLQSVLESVKDAQNFFGTTVGRV